MWRFCRRFWPFIPLVLLVIAVVWFRIRLDRVNLIQSATPPNYTLIEEGLFMGGRVDAPPPGTGAVLNLSEAKDDYNAASYQWSPIPDHAPAPSLEWLKQQVEFIDGQRRAGTTVFVHCDAGISRSGLVMAAYLIWHNHWRRDEALTYVRSKRGSVSPNAAFMELLLKWEPMCAATPTQPG